MSSSNSSNVRYLLGAILCIALAAGCNPFAAKSLTKEEARTELSHQLSNPFKLTISSMLSVEAAASLPGRDRCEIFEIRATPEEIRNFYQKVTETYAREGEFIVKNNCGLANAPLRAGEKGLNPFTKYGIKWWVPWDIKDAIVFDVKTTNFGPGLWFCFSITEGKIFILSWNA